MSIGKALFGIVLAAGIAGLWVVQAAAPPNGAKAEEKAAPAKKEKRVRASDTSLRDTLARTVEWAGLDDPKTMLIETLERISKIQGVMFDINANAFKREDVTDVEKTEIANPYVIPAMKAPLSRVLRAILARVPSKSGTTFLIRKDTIEVTTEAAVRREFGLPMPKLDDKKTNVLDLTPLVWEVFRDEPLDDVFAQLAETMDTTILIDPRCKPKAAAKIDASLRNVPLDTAVELLAEMGGLAVVKRTNAYYVTSPENAERMRKAKEE